jgi:hypothetical protein
MSLEEIARRLQALGVCTRGLSGIPLAETLTKQSSGGYGSKINDLKATFGGLFEPELAKGAYTHWGWVDLDCMMGDLKSSLQLYLPDFDVITYPDGGINALFTAGQLTIFRNIDYFRTKYYISASSFTICEPGNRLFDEKYTMLHAARHAGVSIVVDVYEQVATFDATGSRVDWVPDRGIVFSHIDGERSMRDPM